MLLWRELTGDYGCPLSLKPMREAAEDQSLDSILAFCHRHDQGSSSSVEDAVPSTEREVVLA